MPEPQLIELIARLEMKIDRLEMKIDRQHTSSAWVDETIAAAMLGLTPRVLRRKAKDGQGNFGIIDYRHTNGHRYQYRRKSIEAYMEATSCSPS